MLKTKKLAVILSVVIVLLVALTGGAVADRLWGFKPLDKLIPRPSGGFRLDQKILSEESIVISVAEGVSPSVVTVSAETPQRKILEFSPFGGFRSRVEGGQPQDIGTGFVVSSDGLIVTNKHVVSDTDASYKVITKDGKEYPVGQISRDPSNDIAILKIDATELKEVEFGESGSLKVGQFVIAIGTALGEFRHTVTTGVISGLGRGIVAGSSFEGYVEELDNVIQTDAAINPGNSGGPLLNSAGQVIGVNVAVAQGAENIGFAIPVDIVKGALKEFKETGRFPAKAYLGVQYQIISKQAAILNNVPQGAYVVEVIEGSPAQKAGIGVEDIIVKMDQQELTDKNSLANIVSAKKPGDKIEIEIWREGSTINMEVTLSEFSQ